MPVIHLVVDYDIIYMVSTDVPVGVGAPPLDTKIIFWELNIVIITLVKVILAINHNTK